LPVFWNYWIRIDQIPRGNFDIVNDILWVNPIRIDFQAI